MSKTSPKLSETVSADLNLKKLHYRISPLDGQVTILGSP
jgi:hypothetical protein